MGGNENKLVSTYTIQLTRLTVHGPNLPWCKSMSRIIAREIPCWMYAERCSMNLCLQYYERGVMELTMSSTDSNIVHKAEAGRCVFTAVMARWTDRDECSFCGG